MQKLIKQKLMKNGLYDVQFNDPLEDEYTNLICILVLHKASSITATNLLFIEVNISAEAIHLKKDKVYNFLKPIDLIPNDLTTETVYKAVFQDKDPTAGM